MKQEIEARYGLRATDKTAHQKMGLIRAKVKELAHLIDETCPPTEDKTLALQKLWITMMHANSAVAQGYPIVKLEGST